MTKNREKMDSTINGPALQKVEQSKTKQEEVHTHLKCLMNNNDFK